MLTTPFRLKPEAQVNTSDAPVPGSGGFAVQTDGHVVGLPNGGYVVVWSDISRTHNPAGSAIVGQRFDVAGNKVGGEVHISRFTDGSQFSPKVTFVPGSPGFVAVAFARNQDIHVSVFDASLNFIRRDDIEVTASFASDPAITGFADGSYAVSYTLSQGGPFNDVVGKSVSPAGVVGPAFDIRATGDRSNQAELATLSNGNLVAAYEEGGVVNGTNPSANTNIAYGIFTPTGSSVIPLAAVPGGSGPNGENGPEIAALIGGGFVVVWNDPDGGTRDVHASILTNSGSPVTSDFVVNSTLAGVQSVYDVVPLYDGGFLVSWVDSTAGLRAQRFDHVGDRVGIEFTLRNDPQGAEAALLKDGRIAFALGDTSTGDTDVTTTILDPRTVFSSGDFNGDGTTDLAWRSLSTQAVQTWTIQNAALQSSAVIGAAALQWQSLGNGDVDGNGTDDMLIRNLATGSVRAWFMQNGVLQSSTAIGTAGPDWQPLTAGDFNGDGTDDLLWRNEVTGAVQEWKMQNGVVQSGLNLGFAGLDWQALDPGDFNRDGTDDIAWRNVNTGAVQRWIMNDGLIQSAANIGVASVQWQALGTGDFNGDGTDDFLWRNDGTRAVQIWNLANGALQSSANIGFAGPEWHSLGIGDFNGNGTDDIVWRSVNTGAVQAWTIQNDIIQSAAQFGVAGLEWQLYA
jgi:hypothetical protein